MLPAAALGHTKPTHPQELYGVLLVNIFGVLTKMPNLCMENPDNARIKVWMSSPLIMGCKHHIRARHRVDDILVSAAVIRRIIDAHKSVGVDAVPQNLDMGKVSGAEL